MAEPVDETHRIDHLALSQNSSSSPNAPLTFPPELWPLICQFLQIDMRAEIIQNERLTTTSQRALWRLGKTCKYLNKLCDSQRRKFLLFHPSEAVYLFSLSQTDRTPPEILIPSDQDVVAHIVLEVIPRLHTVILNKIKMFVLWENPIQRMILNPTLTSLTVRSCSIYGQDHNFDPNITNEGLYSIVDLRKSNIKTLVLDYPLGGTTPNPPQSFALLAFIPSLETLTLTPNSFEVANSLPETLSFPRLRNFTLFTGTMGPINRIITLVPTVTTHTLFQTFLRRCPTLESLHIESCFRWKMGPELRWLEMSNLIEYEGRSESLILIRGPALRRALVQFFQWDGGALIRSLADASSALESVVLELTAMMKDPVMEDIKTWMEGAAARWSPNWQSTERFSLVIRTILGEWIYSARVGRTDSGELFLEYYSRREESMAYLAPCAS